MKNFWVIIFIILLSSCNKSDSKLFPLHNKKVLILGNSITQNGRYVDFLEYYLRKNYPDKSLNIISIGLSSETISGDSEEGRAFPRPYLYTRLDRAIKLTKPDVVIACYGMNDGIYSKKDSVRFSNYKTGILNLKNKIETHGAKLILLTPTPFDSNSVKERLSKENEIQSYNHPYFNYNQVLKDYANWLISLKNIKVINLHSALSKELFVIKKNNPDSTFIPDAVHPNDIGHFYMAKKVIADLYPKIIIKDAISEMEQLEKDSLFYLIKIRRNTRSKGWLNHIGYKSEKIVKSDNIDSTISKVKIFDTKINKLLKN